MGNAPSVVADVVFASNTPAVPYLNHMLATFVPENTTFRTNFQNSTQDWMYVSPDTLQGLVAEMGADNWQARLSSLGATSSEPIWTWLSAYWNPLAAPDPSGLRERVTKADVVYIGRRTSAVVSVNTFTFTTNTAGRVRIKVNPANYLYSAQSPAGSLADITVIADGVLTVTQLADDAVAQLNALADFSAHFLASNVAGVVTITGDQPGYPLVLIVRSSTPGPAMTQAITTANVAGAYDTDLDELQAAAEFGSLLLVPFRKYYFITDLQMDDVVNAEGMAWTEDQEDSFTPKRDYIFMSHSQSGDRLITIGGSQVGNFNPLSTASAAANGKAANGGEGWTRGGVWDHDRYEFHVGALAGRCIGYLPGEVSFTAKVLQGSVAAAAARMQPRDYGDNESLSHDRTFNWYSGEGPGQDGSAKWGYLCDGKWIDDKWAEDYIEYQVRVDLLSWMQLKNIVTYTDVDIKGGEAVIAAAIAKIPAVIKESIGVVSLARDAVNPANIIARVYYDYTGTGSAANVINQMGTLSNPIAITILQGG